MQQMTLHTITPIQFCIACSSKDSLRDSLKVRLKKEFKIIAAVSSRT